MSSRSSKRGFSRVAAITAVSVMISVFGCSSTPVTAKSASFCSTAKSSKSTCKDPTDCDATVTQGCSTLGNGVSASTIAAANDCLQSGVCGVSDCLSRAKKSAKPGDAHTQLAQDYCTFCAPNVDGCQDQFYAKTGGLPGGLVLPYADAIVTAVDTACTADRDKCRAQFAQCATDTIASAIGDALDADLADCVTTAFKSDGTTSTGPGGGPQITTCTPANCPGCCRDDKCETGTDTTTCGAGAAACQVCRGAQKCTAGQCKEPCSTNNCNGCCDGGGNCVPGTATTACGTQGGACTTCTTQGATFVCSNHTCIDGSCQASCLSGCCSAQGCITNLTASACGTGGEGCIDCGAGRTCSTATATCDLDQDSLWDFYVSFADVPAMMPDGTAWDPTNGAPDPYVVAFSNDAASNSHTGQTTTQKDSAFPFWAETPLTGIKASELLNSLSFQVWDEDSVDDPTDFDDFMGGCDIPLTIGLFDGSLQSIVCPASATSGEITLYYRIKPH